MRNVKRSTLYILAACLAVVLLCCCVGGIYFACRGEGRGVVKAEAASSDYSDIPNYDPDLDVPNPDLFWSLVGGHYEGSFEYSSSTYSYEGSSAGYINYQYSDSQNYLSFFYKKK